MTGESFYGMSQIVDGARYPDSGSDFAVVKDVPDTFDHIRFPIRVLSKGKTFDFPLQGEVHTKRFLEECGLSPDAPQGLVGKVVRILGRVNSLDGEVIIVGPVYGIKPEERAHSPATRP